MSLLSYPKVEHFRGVLLCNEHITINFLLDRNAKVSLCCLNALFVVSTPVIGKGEKFERSAIQGPIIGGPFSLIDTEGQLVTEKNLLGNWVLLYFGYTSSPDVGPAEVRKMANTINMLGFTSFLYLESHILFFFKTCFIETFHLIVKRVETEYQGLTHICHN